MLATASRLRDFHANPKNTVSAQRKNQDANLAERQKRMVEEFVSNPLKRKRVRKIELHHHVRCALLSAANEAVSVSSL